MTINLVLFFTTGVSLQTWEHGGMLERELALYRELGARGIASTFITYGDRYDLTFQRRLPGIRILCNRWGLPPSVYRRLMPLLFAGPLRHSNLLKSNQVKGADIALRAARFWRKPLIARCGYLWSTFAINKNGERVVPAADYAHAVEQKVFGAAAGIIVTTAFMAQDIGRRFPGVHGRIAVIPNYVDTELFRPAQQHECQQELIFIGRLTEQKNVAALIEAANRLRVRLLIIGDGDRRDFLEQRYGDADGRIRWRGIVPHAELPSYLQRSSVFVLPSHYEGHPKTLIEAMACGMPVIGSDTPGIRDVIQHGENGWRCGTDPESIAAAIRHLLADAELRSRLGRNARAYAVREYALDRVVDRELALYRKVVPVPSP